MNNPIERLAPIIYDIQKEIKFNAWTFPINENWRLKIRYNNYMFQYLENGIFNIYKSKRIYNSWTELKTFLTQNNFDIESLIFQLETYFEEYKLREL